MRIVLPLLALTCLSALAAAQPRPKLVVVIAVDQCTQELIQRWAKDLPGGLGQLVREGTTFTAAYHDHGFTETGPGHSVILSGRFPGHTGITENRWWDRSTGKAIYCVQDDATTLVGAPTQKGSSPQWFLGTALGDWLQAQVPGSRVFAVSGKDRAAILLAGRKPTAVYWFTPDGRFTTSTAYATVLPSWLEAVNRELALRFRDESWVWTPLVSHTGQVRMGDLVVDGQTLKLGLPHPIKTVGMPVDAAFDKRFRASPFLDQAILDVSEALMEGERLGRGPGTDLLALSLTATDAIGHTYGHGGEEMRDQIMRLDQRLGQFLAKLRGRVPGAWVLLTADHGASDAPERLVEQGIPARRVDAKRFLEALNRDLETWKSGASGLYRPHSTSMLYLKEGALKDFGLDGATALQALRKALLARPEVAEVASAEELAAWKEERKDPATLSLRGRLALSYTPGRSGDLMVAYKPYVSFSSLPGLSDHYSPWDYDRRVPLIFYGPWRSERRSEPVSVVDLAPTLAFELGIAPTEQLDGKVLDLRRRKAP